MMKEGESRIDRSMRITGIVLCRGRVVLEGVMEGRFSGTTLEISSTGSISGEITARSIDCAGRLAGSIATEDFILRSTGCHVGTAETKRLKVDSGAVLDCVVQSGIPTAENLKTDDDAQSVAPTVLLGEVLTAFQEGVRPCCMDIPWSARLELYSHLLHLLQKDKPLIKVTGENGSGKTVLAAKLRNSPPTGCQVLEVRDQVGSVAELLLGVAADLGVTGIECASQKETLVRIKAVLGEKRRRGKKVVLLVDDVQLMYPATLEGIIRLLTNACGKEDEMLQIILLGTQEMEANMVATILEYFEDETNCQLDLEPLNIKDAADYLRFCLQIAATGNGRSSLAFLPYETIRTIHVLSRGNIAGINRLADQALHAAHAAGSPSIFSDFLSSFPIQSGQ